MKSDKYQKRSYRDWVKASGLCKAEVAVQETDLHILTDKPVDKDFVEDKIRLLRRHIEGYIQKDHRFLTSLSPLAVEKTAPLIVRDMGRAALQANVGPMAAVAGAIAKFLGTSLLRKGYRDVIIENGGDIFLKTTQPRILSIYSGSSVLSQKICLKIKPGIKPMGICTSSGTVGHSLSFGCADSVVIIAADASLADAAATAVGNRVHTQEDLPAAIDFARSLKGISGAVIVFGDRFASWGNIEFTA
ncbi:MAG: UPF0280 family protein [Candidatus Omnitrophota bacterium]|jgi:hypothetical protein